MRNPNGYGSVYKLSGTRRKPYAARVTIGFKPENGYPIYKFIGYYKTRAEAMTALALYNDAPEDYTFVNKAVTPINKITLERVYNEWAEEHFKTLKNDAHYRSAIKVLAPLYDTSIAHIKIYDYERVFQESGKNYSILKIVKIALKQMYQFAFRKGYISESIVGIPTFISLEGYDKNHREERRPFTHEEIDTLWKHKEDNNVQFVLFMIYTGLRIGEAMSMRADDVNIEERYLTVRKAKTEAGVRKVPIADKIMFIVSSWLSESQDYLVPLGDMKPSVKVKPNFNGFNEAIKKYLNEKHEQHETRYTCATLLTEAGVDDRFVKIICGHAQKDVTNRVYAKKVDMSVLLEAINRI